MARQATGGVILAALVLAAAWLSAQYYERPLAEQDLQRLIPVLKADRAGADRLGRLANERAELERTRAAARQKITSEIVHGTDPLEWLAHLTPQAVAPSTARYQQRCSRALVESTGVPSAVFTFGVAAPSSWLAVWKARDATAAIGDRSEASSRPNTPRPGATRPETVTQQTRAFYGSRGFEYQGEAAPFEWQFVAGDGVVSATVMGVNLLGHVEACRELASGPTVVLKAEGPAFGKAPAGQTAGPAANRELEDALDQAGLTGPEYMNLKLQLRNAQADAQDSSRLSTLPTSTPEEQKVVEIRRLNAEVYRRHADVLAPLLAGLQ